MTFGEQSQEGEVIDINSKNKRIQIDTAIGTTPMAEDECESQRETQGKFKDASKRTLLDKAYGFEL